MNNSRIHFIAVFQALLVTFLWSTSFIIIKWGLHDIPPITFAGLRYTLACLCFIPFIFKRKYIAEIKGLKSYQWKKLLYLGIIFYTVTQGTQFLGLNLLPAVTVSLMLNFTPLVVIVLGILFIKEKPSFIQVCGTLLFITGILIYFSPAVILGNEGTGLFIMSIGVIANAGAAILGRDINRSKNISPFTITVVSMSIGSSVLLISGLALEGFPVIHLAAWIYLFWLSLINTAFAFTLWNLTLRNLTAVESSIINGTMLIQITILGSYFLGESISPREGTGILIAAGGAVLVQIRRKRKVKDLNIFADKEKVRTE